jgi:hypothetical protein
MPYVDRFSLACVEMALSESMMDSDIAGNREFVSASVTLLKAHFNRMLSGLSNVGRAGRPARALVRC